MKIKALIFSIAALLAAQNAYTQILKGSAPVFFEEKADMDAFTPSLPYGSELAFVLEDTTLYRWSRAADAWTKILTSEVYTIASAGDTSTINPAYEGDVAYVADTLLFIRSSFAWLPFSGGSSGSTETADGLTILGDGTGGDPFRVNTTLLATRTYADSLFSVADSLREAGDRSTPILIQAFDRIIQLDGCSTSETVITGFQLIDDTPIDEGGVTFEIGSPQSITYDVYNEDSTSYYFETSVSRTAGIYTWEVGYTDPDGNFVGDTNLFEVMAGTPDTVTVWLNDSISVTRRCGVEIRRDTIASGGGGGTNLAIANQAATGDRTHDWGNYDLVFNNIDSFSLAVGAKRINITQNGNKFLHQPAGTGNGDVFENTFMGYKAGQAFATNATGYANVFLGYEAGTAMTGLNIGGGYNSTSNTLVGYRAGRSLTASAGNTIIGTMANSADTLGSSNTMVGWHAGQNQYGSGNSILGANAAINNRASNIVAISPGALDNNTAQYTIGIGTNAMRNNTGAFNVGIGYLAGNGNTSGKWSTFFGVFAGQGASTGQENTFVGYTAGQAGGDQGYNTFVGSGAGQSNASNTNTMIGRNAGVASSGAGNIFIGSNSSDGHSTGDNNISIGTSIEQPVLTGSNQLNIGNVIRAKNIYNATGLRFNLGKYASPLVPATLTVYSDGTTQSDTILALYSSGNYSAGTATERFYVLSDGQMKSFCDFSNSAPSSHFTLSSSYFSDELSSNSVFSAISLTPEINEISQDTTSAIHIEPTLTSASSYKSVWIEQNGGQAIVTQGTATNYFGGATGLGVASPTAAIHLKAGTATASTAPLKIEAGTNLTTPEAGAVEWDGSRLYATQTSGPTRKTIAYTDDLADVAIDGGMTDNFLPRYDETSETLVDSDIEDDGTTITAGFNRDEVEIIPLNSITMFVDNDSINIYGPVTRIGSTDNDTYVRVVDSSPTLVDAKAEEIHLTGEIYAPALSEYSGGGYYNIVQLPGTKEIRYDTVYARVYGYLYGAPLDSLDLGGATDQASITGWTAGSYNSGHFTETDSSLIYSGPTRRVEVQFEGKLIGGAAGDVEIRIGYSTSAGGGTLVLPADQTERITLTGGSTRDQFYTSCQMQLADGYEIKARGARGDFGIREARLRVMQID